MESEVNFTTAAQLYAVESSEECFSTGVPEIDDLFENGIPPATFLELVGCSATGKTQLCMQLCALAQKRKGRKNAVYIDTEGGFSTNRLCEIARGHFEKIPENFLELIKHSRCTDLVQLMSAVHRLQGLLEKNSEIGLIVVDSIAMPFRGETDYMKSAIISISSVLSRIAVAFRCLVVVVNHVTTKFHYGEDGESSYLSSALGTSWSQRPCFRAWLCPPDVGKSIHTFHLVKSPIFRLGFVSYTIKMKFLAVLADQGATDVFSRIAETVFKLTKDHVVLRVARNSFSFVSAECSHTSGVFFEISLNINEFFSTLTMAGVSEEYDEIFMEIDKESFYRSINSKEHHTKMRLTKIRDLPHLKIELKTFAVVHEIPIDLIPTRQWKQYTMPSIAGVKVFQGNQRGELYFNGDIDAANIQIYFSGLLNSAVDEPDEDPNTFSEVRVNVRDFHTLLRSINSNFTLSKILLKIVPGKVAAFFIQQNDASLIYAVSAVVL